MSKIRAEFFRQQDRTIFQKLKVLRQLFDSYVMCEAEGKIFLIDQHAAHEKIRYEKLRQDYFNKPRLEMQNLISPVIITLTKLKDKRIIMQNLDRINKFGFKVEFITEDTIMIRSVPTFSYRKVVPSVIKKIKDILLDIENQRITEERLLQLCACHSSIRANTKLSIKEMYRLISQLSMLENPWICPHGRPIMRKAFLEPGHTISKKDLDKEFKRI